MDYRLAVFGLILAGCTPFRGYMVSASSADRGCNEPAIDITAVREVVEAVARRNECVRRNPVPDAREDWKGDMQYVCYDSRDHDAYQESVVWLSLRYAENGCAAEIGLSEWGIRGETPQLIRLRDELGGALVGAAPEVEWTPKLYSNGWLRP